MSQKRDKSGPKKEKKGNSEQEENPGAKPGCASSLEYLKSQGRKGV